jgi:hypothetical protein
MRTRTAAAETIAMLERLKEEARERGDRDLVTTYGLALGLIAQFVNVTPRSPQLLTCQECRGCGKTPRWFHAEGRYLDVYCKPCQGSGVTWNPHPNCRHDDLKGEM